MKRQSHSRRFVFLFFAVTVGMTGLIWWLFNGDTPTIAQIIEDACADAKEAEFGTMTTHAEGVADSVDGERPFVMSVIVEFNPTAIRIRSYLDDVMEQESIVIVTTSLVEPGSTLEFMGYTRIKETDGKWGDWVVIEGKKTIPDDLPDTDFCGLTADELSDLQYVGSETVDGISTRHYSGTLKADGTRWNLWVGPDGRPVKAEGTVNSHDPRFRRYVFGGWAGHHHRSGVALYNATTASTRVGRPRITVLLLRFATPASPT